MGDWVQMKVYYTLCIFKFTFSSLNLLLNKVTVSNSITQWPSAFWENLEVALVRDYFSWPVIYCLQGKHFAFFFCLP